MKWITYFGHSQSSIHTETTNVVGQNRRRLMGAGKKHKQTKNLWIFNHISNEWINDLNEAEKLGDTNGSSKIMNLS